ncbi:MAG: hypothetical protein V9G19_18245 [Tetrasphaera sp.]
MDYNHLWHLARERLNLLPQQVDPNLQGADAIRAIHQSTWNIADQVNATPQPPGHRPRPHPALAA